MLTPLTVWITTNCGKFWKRWEYQTTLSASWETCMQVKKQQLESDMKQQICSKLGKEYVKAIYILSPCLFNLYSAYIMLNARLYETQTEINIARRNISNLKIGRWHHPNGRRWRGTREPLDESKIEEWESWLKIHHSKNEDHGIRSHHFMADRWGKRWKL